MMEQRWVNVRVRVTFRVSGRVSVRAYIGSGTHIGAIFFSWLLHFPFNALLWSGISAVDVTKMC